MSEKLINIQQSETLLNAVLTKVKNKSYAVTTDIAPTETSPAAAAHAQGDLLIYGGVLYKAKTDIAVGATLTVGTNIEATTVATEVKNSGLVITVDSAMSDTSENPVQNKVITSALDGKVDTVNGKGLSTNDYTTAEKNKLAALDNSIMECEDVTNSVTYDVKFQLYQGKPRLVYEEVE